MMSFLYAKNQTYYMDYFRDNGGFCLAFRIKFYIQFKNVTFRENREQK